MCDLWEHTTDEILPVGAIPAQMEYAFKKLSPATHLKLFNSGSFFDPKAIPVEDYKQIAALSSTFGNVLVESHTAFIGEQCLEFDRMLNGQMEVAIGLETVHPEVLPRLNKGMSLEELIEGFELLYNRLYATEVLRERFRQAKSDLDNMNSAMFAFRVNLDWQTVFQHLIDNLKGVCASYGLGNDVHV